MLYYHFCPPLKTSFVPLLHRIQLVAGCVQSCRGYGYPWIYPWGKSVSFLEWTPLSPLCFEEITLLHVQKRGVYGYGYIHGHLCKNLWIWIWI